MLASKQSRHFYRKPHHQRMRVLTAQVDDTGKKKKNIVQRLLGVFTK